VEPETRDHALTLLNEEGVAAFQAYIKGQLLDAAAEELHRQKEEVEQVQYTERERCDLTHSDALATRVFCTITVIILRTALIWMLTHAHAVLCCVCRLLLHVA
jgi:hypothetical protein